MSMLLYVCTANSEFRFQTKNKSLNYEELKISSASRISLTNFEILNNFLLNFVILVSIPDSTINSTKMVSWKKIKKLGTQY